MAMAARKASLPIERPQTTVAGRAGHVDMEEHLLRKYFSRQFVVLTRRHSAEHAILLRVIADYHHYAVIQAKEGQLQSARFTLRTLQDIGTFDKDELIKVRYVSSLPAAALIEWLEGKHDEAIRLLDRALNVCFELVTRFDHDYLTAKRIHLASNTARVLVSRGSLDQAVSRVDALKAVIAGERGSWPFDAPESLDIPLVQPERQVLESQLARIALKAAEQGWLPR